VSENGFRAISAFEWTEDRTKAACCLAAGGTQDEAATEAGVTDRTIRNWLQDVDFAAEVDRLSLMVGISSRAERLRLAMRVVKDKTGGNVVKTDKDLLEWLKFAQSETDGIKLDITKLAAALDTDEASVALGGSAGDGDETEGEAVFS
jgi:hypothetical protein